MKVAFSWKTAWFISGTRRHRLTDRSTVLSLFSITHPPVHDKEETTYVLGSSSELGFNLPEAFLDACSAHRHPGDYIPSEVVLTPATSLDQVESNYLIIEVDGYYYGLHADKEWHMAAITLGPITEPPYKTKDWMVLRPGDIENYEAIEGVKREPIVTTYGRYLANYRVFCDTFKHNQNHVLDNELSYKNEYWKIGKIESVLADLLVDDKVSVDECSTYIDNGYALGAFGEIVGTTFTRKSLIPSEAILKKRDELLHEHRKELKDPRIMAIIENELVNMDKAYMKGDPSMDFLGQSGKYFSLRRKKQFILGGMVVAFGEQRGKYHFIKESHAETMDGDSFAIKVNDARSGFYNRAVETQVGGLDAKWMMYVFQNCKIIEEDCQSKQYLEITIFPGMESTYLGQYVLTSKGTLVPLSKENIKDYIGKPIKLRSMMYCKTKYGYCRTCAGEIFKKMEYDNISAIPIDVGGIFTQESMDTFHGLSVSITTIDNLEDYLVN